MNIVAPVFLSAFVWVDQLSSNSNYRAFAAGVEPEGNATTPRPIDFAHIFNNHRQYVSPPSSNMMLLEWNEQLAAFSTQVTSSCTWSENSPATPDGQYLVFQLVVPFAEDLEDYITQHLNNASARCKEGNCDDFYLITIWHGIQQIGCAFEECNTQDINGSLVVCFYDTEPDVDSLEEAYTIGDPCSNCPGDFPACDTEYSLCVGRVPTIIRVIQQPGPNATKAGVPFATNTKIEVLDENGNRFTGKKNPACHYEIAMEFAMRSHHEARLRGNDVAPLKDGVAEFKDVAISEHGEYKLRLFLDSPKNHTHSLIAESDTLQIAMPPHTLDMCVITEGDPQFERHYDWSSPNCTAVCIEDCKGQNSQCFNLEECGPNAYCEDGACVCKTWTDLTEFKFNAESLRELTKPRTICEPNRIAIRLDKCGLNAIGFALKDMYMLGPKISSIDIDYLEDIDEQLFPYIQTCTHNDCRGYVTVGEHGLEYEFGVSGNFGDCNADVTDNGTHINYKHKVRGFGGFSNAKVSRKRMLAYEISCTYVQQARLSSDFGVDVFLGSISMGVADYGQFDVSIGLWTDSTYNERYTAPPEILVPDVVYVGIQLEGLEATPVILYADHCYATPTEDPDDVVSVDLINNGCANDSDVRVAQNGEDKEVYFSFDSFVFGDQPEDNTTMYVHCSVIICVSDDEPCTVSCNSRRKRAAAPVDRLSKTVSIGPVNIDNEKKLRKRGVPDHKYSSYFNKAFSTQALANPPAARTSGIPNVEIYFT